MTTVDQTQTFDLDTKLLSEFIYALNIARRQVMSYPPGHPMVATATAKLIDVVPRLLEFRKEITLGIARDALIIDGGLLDAGNPVFQDLARNLFDVRIASLTVTQDLVEKEILKFFAIFQKSSEELAEEGGIESIVVASGLKGIRAQSVDFSVFSTTEVAAVHAPKIKTLEGDAALLWKSFVSGMVSGSLDPDGVKYTHRADLNPVLLAEILNKEYSEQGSSVETSYEEAITMFLNQEEQGKLRYVDYQNTVGRLGEMVGNLKPELRRKFLNSTLKTCAQRPDTAEVFLKNMPQPTLLDALEYMDAGVMDVPQTLLDVLGKLSAHRGDEVSRSRVAGESIRSVQETAEQLTALFKEDHSEYFVPRDYQDALAVMAVAKVDHRIEKAQFEELLMSMDSRNIDGQFSTVLIDMLGRGVDEPTVDAIDENLKEMVDYFLGTGDFESLLYLYRLLCADDTVPSGKAISSAQETLARFTSEEFVDEVLDGFDAWGKTFQPSIQSLIEDVGCPFVKPLLERLGDESSMSRRRLFMSCLVRIGPQAKDIVAAQLKDHRWFFVRNMVVILREINDPSVVPLLGSLSDYDHPKVQSEVLKTFLHYEDDRANLFLIKALSSRNSAKLLNAVRLAANSRDSRVVDMLAKLLSKRLSGEQELEVKGLAIKAMEESATESVLPELTNFFLGRKMFGASKIESLKVPAIAILKQIGTVDAGIMAGQIAQTSSGELAKAAEEALAEIHRELT
jgi:hypothetical protein